MTKLLIVDDNEQNLYMLQVLLQGHGYEVVSAANGAEALEMARRDRPDMIITDILMPVMDGFALCREWKTDEQLKHVPLVFYTATYTDPKDEKFALSLGAERFLIKPTEPDVFIKVVQEIIEEHQAGRLVAPQEPIAEEPVYLKEYSQTLVRKLEDKVAQLEQTNRSLEHYIAELKQTEESLRKANRAYRVLSGCNQALVRATVEAELLQAVCRIIVEDGGYSLAWVGFAEQDKTRTVRLVAQAGCEAGYLDTVNITWADTERGRGPTGTAIRTGRPVINRDVLTDPKYDPWRTEAAKCGYASSIALPLLIEKQVVGALNVYSAEPDAFDTEELNLLTELTSDLAYGIMSIRMRAERKRTEEVLQRREASLAEAQRIARLGNWEWNIVNNTDAWSDEVYRILGLAPQQIEATYEAFLDFVHPNDRELVKQAVDEALYDSKPYSIDHRVILPDGLERIVHEQAEVTFDETGRPIRMTGTIQDITEHRELEEQLRQTQKIEAIGRLAGGVAHDFNNVLTVIIGCTGFLMDRYCGDNPGLECEDIKQIMQAAERAASLTRQLLAFSRQQILQPQVLDLNVVIANLTKMLRRLIGEDVELTTILAKELGRVKADPGQIEQVIMNLAVNARDAMPTGGQLTIETANIELDEAYTYQHVDATPGRYVMLAVSDTGQGMDAETRSRIFEPFFTTKEAGEGTGLGLSTVHGIVKQSGGHIWLYSEPGLGTTFKIYLPRLEMTAEPIVRRDQVFMEPAQVSETILLVEDEDAVRQMASRVLRITGYTILEACHGSEAIRVCEGYDDPIHLVVTDVVMPGGISGPDLAKQLLSLYPGLKVLYTSGYTDRAIVHHGVLESGVAFLQKPFRPRVLVQKVREVLDAE